MAKQADQVRKRSLNHIKEMNLEIFTLCDYACDYGHSKLNIIGTFDHVFSPVYPFRLPQCAVATRMRIGNHEAGPHTMVIKIIDSEGKPIQSVEGKMTVPKHQTEDYVVINFPMNIGGLTFPKAGKYAAELHWDGEFQAGLTIYAVQVQPMQRAA